MDETFYESIKAKFTFDCGMPSDSSDKLKLVERKFFYAGHSARWFF